MKHRFLYIPIALLFMLAFVDCAKKGTPSGGPRDTIPPGIVRSSPENYSTNFQGDEIEIRFDEYIKLKDVNQQLIISPPMEYAPIITPLSTSKTLKIKLQDTLLPNTTYSFNFGNSIVDNNEGNVYPYFKYVFSTGSYIDSLKLTGRVRDAQLIAPEIPTTVMLYEKDEAYNDSIIYSEKPRYITVTKDSTGAFELSNLKAGEYLLMALKEKTNDYMFQPKNDKIAFVEETVTVPTDSTYILTLFKEIPDYNFVRAGQVGKNHLVFGYEGRADSLAINLLSEVPDDYTFKTFKDETKDTVHYWYKPAVQVDSLVFWVKNGRQIDTATVRMREMYADSLKISPLKTGYFTQRDSFMLRANTPLVSYDIAQFRIMDKDSAVLEPTVTIDHKFNRAKVIFPKKEDQSYSITLLPGALVDFFENTHDTLRFNVKTRLVSDYGTLNLSLVNARQFPMIVQILGSKYQVVAERYLTENEAVFFDELTPDKYFLRIIYDENQNGQWDTGSFLNRLQPERIIYYPKQIEVRANWSLNETFTLK